MRGAAILIIFSILLATFYGVLFSLAYPSIEISNGLVTLFTIIAFATCLLVVAIWKGITEKQLKTGVKNKGEAGKADVTTILFLSSDPTNEARLRLGEEVREIQQRLQLARLRDTFRLETRMSVRPADISQALLDMQPRILHFSGHGSAAGELCFADELGKTKPVSPDALSSLFQQFSSTLNCVVLNACYSKIQADAIAKHIGYVVGMNQAIGDKAAIAFAVGFYQAIGGGRSIEEAYQLGRVQIALHGIPEELTPVLVMRSPGRPENTDTKHATFKKSAGKKARVGDPRMP
jgi:hypothetical protein